MNISKIHNEGAIQYDKFLIDKLVTEKADISETKETDKSNESWRLDILNEGLTKLENNIQSKEDTSPLSYNSAPPIENMTQAEEVISELNMDEIKNNINNIFADFNTSNLVDLFSETADMKF